MTGLWEHERDTSLLERSGDSALRPPSPDQLLLLVHEHLVRSGAEGPCAATLEYARWKPRTSVTAGYALHYPNGDQRWVTWKRYVGDKATSLAQRSPRQLSSEVRDPLLIEDRVLPEHGAHLWAPPYDRELPGFERAGDLRRTKRLLLELGVFPGRRVRSAPSRVEILRYKPERRAVLRLDLRLRPLGGGAKSSEQLALRVLPPVEAARVLQARTAFESVSAPSLCPALVGREERTGLIFEEWLDLEPVSCDDTQLAREAGALLARLHATPLASAPPCPGRTMSALAPLFNVAPQVARAASSLLESHPKPTSRSCWVHGDFHPDQLAARACGGGLVLLDLDRLGIGDPIEDLASWTSDLLQREEGISFGAATAELLAGYASGGGHVPQRQALAVATATELVHRAAAALRRLEVDATGAATRLLRLARELAPRGSVFA